MTNNQLPSLADLDLERIRETVAGVGVAAEELADSFRRAILAAQDILELEPEHITARRRTLADLASKRVPVRQINAGARLPVTIKSRTGQPGKRMQR